MPTKPKTHRPQQFCGKTIDAEARRFRSGRRWTEFSRRFRDQHPFCLRCWCECQRLEKAEQAHHLTKLAVSLEDALSEADIVPTCRACHEVLENASEPDYVQRWRTDETFRDSYWRTYI